jgi:uncharacterized membrane protein
MTDHEDYAHIRDPQSERTKWEVWAIVAILVVVLVCSIVWRTTTHHPGKAQTNWNHNSAASSANPGAASSSSPAAAADTPPH